MLDPQDRQHLFAALQPPPSYQLDHAIGTTFTLDLLAAMTVPLAFSLFAGDSEDTLALLQALQTNAKRITLFCQAGRISVPPRYEMLFSYLEPRIVQVTAAKQNGVFHPKVWALRYVAADRPVRYRLLVASRNLTFDRSWDTLLCLDGALIDRKVGFGRNRPLYDFFSALPTLAQHPLPPTPLLQMADELRRVDFEVPPQFDKEQLEFLPIGHTGRKQWPFPNTAYAGKRRLLVMSPFLASTTLQRLSKLAPMTLVTRLQAAQELSAESQATLSNIYTLSDLAEQLDESDSDRSLTGLHAKLFLLEQGYNATLWIGSANATNAAFNNNVEFMVGLHGKKSQMGIDKLLPTGMQSGFGKLLLPFTAEGVAVGDTVQEQLQDRLEAARRSLAEITWQADVAADEDAWSLRLRRPALDLWHEISCEIRPISLNDSHNRPNASHIAWNAISFQAITSFFAFTLTIESVGQSASLRFVLNVPLANAPTDRHDQLVRHLLSDAGTVLRYLRLLLADSPLALLSADEWQTGIALEGGGYGILNSAELYESLVRTLAQRPERLPAIAHVIDTLRATPDRLPDGLLTIWEPIWQAYGEIYGEDNQHAAT